MKYKRFMCVVDIIFSIIWAVTAICPISYVVVFTERPEENFDFIYGVILAIAVSALAIGFEWLLWRFIELAAKVRYGTEDDQNEQRGIYDE